MILLVGLGNPGKKYEHTRHNLGRMLVFNWFYDHLNETDSMTRGKFDTFNPRIDISGTCVICQTPETFMNNSGDDVQAAAHFYKIPPHNIWIVMDDLNLDFGVIRTRQSGSDGGHNGLKSILENMGTKGIPRIRIGIGNNSVIPAEDYVLQKFTKDELSLIQNDIYPKYSDLVSKSITSHFPTDTLT
ncbi:MAG TPA: aminoacyl-tRNA hydrolase [Patescibacteria group bacterium]|nr:aminoacyl-tRNA hydrolase [Patescibacteria group bacterium]